MAPETPNIDWRVIVETIREEKCVLFLGPEIIRTSEGLPLEEALENHLKVYENPDVQAYYPDDGLFLFTSGIKKTKSYYSIKSFYQDPFPETESVLELLAEIPFHLIISITPDHLMQRVFKRKGIKHQFKFYWKKQPVDRILHNPSQQNPLVYNLLGSIDCQESMVLTHNDMFDFFDSIFQEDSLPEKLKLNIKGASNFIFLGMDFKKWYMHLLLRTLHFHDEHYDFMRYAANQEITEDLKSFCYEHFKIEFIPNKVDTFVAELHQHCQQAGIIRQPDQENLSFPAKLRNWIASDEIEKVLTNLRTHLEHLGRNGEEFLDDVLLLNGKFRRLNRKVTEFVIDQKDAELERNKIRKNLLELIKEIEVLP